MSSIHTHPVGARRRAVQWPGVAVFSVLGMALALTAPARAELFTWTGACFHQSLGWDARCEIGNCDPNGGYIPEYENNWARLSCYPNYPALPGGGDDVVISAGGTADLQGAASIRTLVCNGTLFVSGTTGGPAILHVSTPVTINGRLQYAGGWTQNCTVTIAPGGFMDKISGGQIDGGSLINQGLGTWVGEYGLVVTNGAELRNEGIFEFRDRSSIVVPNGTFRSSGVLRKLDDSGQFTISGAPIELSGVVEVQTGTLVFAVSQCTSSAALVLAPGATLRFSGQTFTLLAGTTVTGAGLLFMEGGVLHVQPNLTVPNLYAGGTLDVQATLTCTSSLETAGLTFAGPGETVIAPGATWSISPGNCWIDHHTIFNHGSATWGGVFGNNIGSSSVIENTGTIENVGANWGRSDANEPGPVLNNSGTYHGWGGINGIAFNNTGLVHITGESSLYPYTQTAGELRIDGGTHLAAGYFDPILLQGGRLTGNGSIVGGHVENTGGTVAPGTVNTTGTLTFDRGYIQGAGGTLEIRLGGTDPEDYDQLALQAGANLDGTLRLRLADNFRPAPGQSFTVVTAVYGTTGQFASVTGPGRFAVDYPGAEVIVRVLNGPGDLNCSGAVDFGDINPFVLALSNPAGYAQQFPNCDIHTGDCNGDGVVNFSDINPFVALLTGW